jgi:hypothetical protein
MRKTRSDSVLDGLPENQRALIERWLCEDNLGLDAVKQKCHDDLNLKVSRSALSEFFQRCSRRRMLDRIAESSAAAKSVTEQFRSNPDSSFEALLGLIGQAAFEKKMNGEDLDLGTLKDLTEIMAIGLKVKTDTKKIAQKDEQLALQRQKLEMDVSKLAMREAASIKTISSASKLTQSEKLDAIRKKLFGQLPKTDFNTETQRTQS